MTFLVTVIGLVKVYDLPNSWADEDYLDLLNQLEIEDLAGLAGNDLLEILLMALQDLEPEDAADLVLSHKLRNRITPGSRQNIVQDLMEGQRPWEEFADVRLHPCIFTAAVLLYKALPKLIEKPDIRQLTLKVQGLNAEAKRFFEKAPEAAFVARMLADGMNENSILERLYDEQLYSHSFPEADGIIWQADFTECSAAGDSFANLVIYSSLHWLEAMKTVDEFKSNAYNDRPKVDRGGQSD